MPRLEIKLLSQAALAQCRDDNMAYPAQTMNITLTSWNRDSPPAEHIKHEVRSLPQMQLGAFRLVMSLHCCRMATC